MAIKYIKIFQPKALQNVPKLVFWFENKPSGNPGQSCDQELQLQRIKIYQTMRSLVRFENKNIFFYFEKTL
jgi:hypothetical protein